MDICNILNDMPNYILKHKVFQMILKNDFVIYGGLLKDMLIGKKNMEDYTNDSDILDRSINIYGKISYREILERDIGEFIVKPFFLGNDIYSKTIFISYTLIIGEIEFILDVLYVKNDMISHYLNFYDELAINVSIDKLQMNRLGLSVIDNKIGAINPFMDIISEIVKKEFNVILKLKPFTKKQCEYLQYLNRKGYKNKNNIIIPYRKKDQECNICYDTEYTEFSQLECKHIFHKKCLQKAIDEAIKESQIFKCPYCNNKYLNYEVL
jgi:hypothetical protein